jgi:putative ABC transport system permease protein
MGKVALIGRLAIRNVRRRPAQALLLLLAISASTTVLTLGLVLHGVTARPYQQTRAATNGPDVVAQLGGPASLSGSRPMPAARVATQVTRLTHAAGVTAHSGPFPVASAILRVHGLRAAVEAEGRSQAPAAVEQPKVTAGSWVRPGGVVLERTFAEALGAGVGSRVTLSGQVYTVAGIAVTAAAPPYPNLCYQPGGGTCDVFDLPDVPVSTRNLGLAWVTESDARALAAAGRAPLWYFLNLRLRDPAQAAAFAAAQAGVGSFSDPIVTPVLAAWPSIAAADGLLVQDEQSVLSPGAWLTGLLALASATVLAGARMAERTRRTGLLKAVGGTPGLVATVLLAENLLLALLAAAVGLITGWLTAPLISSPGAALVGSPGAPSVTLRITCLVVGAALVVALTATLVPSIRAARTSTVRALAGPSRSPKRRAGLNALSARLPVPLLLGLRLAARRPRRALLSAASIAVTATGIVAVLAFHAAAGHSLPGGAGGLGNPVVDRDEQMLLVLTVALVALSVLNALCATWATALDTTHASALARALGATPRQVSAGIAAAQVIPALPGAVLGIPLGIELYAAASGGGHAVIIPPAWWLAAAEAGIVIGVAVLASIPARLTARRPAAEILQTAAD